ncbi:uncharacterized protein BP5553_06225 [Venustampulla echinocandica]|uniref:RING-type E3 ubiquitin transferase n=1 Tax=Venustampulla echinocandica TaxID=2656787 RepID=A0A370TMV8_9HELO|nr:uncharacterized protein BP5553_06225 [Venustampulla echinocandica]RDL36873.1 hypothetical protein BP5553_06225 [Venustampulla echinocandica]
MENQDSTLAAGASTPQVERREERPLPPIPPSEQEVNSRAEQNDATLFQGQAASSPEERSDAEHQYEAWRDADLESNNEDSHTQNQPKSTITSPAATGPGDSESRRSDSSGSQREAAGEVAGGEIESPIITPSGNVTFRPGPSTPSGDLPISTPPIPFDRSGGPSSSERPLPLPPTSSDPSPRGGLDGAERESVMPRWQPDAEVTICPICGTQFSFFIRKHHCRKCGRVVCNSCSPHRITIPHPYIVRPPTEDAPPTPLTRDSARSSISAEFRGIGGGERVRLCNPCVPDPNVAPPQSNFSNSPASSSQPSGHSRSSSAMSPFHGQYQHPGGSQSNPILVQRLRNAPRRPRESSILGQNNSSHSQNLQSRGSSYNTREGHRFVDPLESRSRSSTVGGNARDIYYVVNNLSDRPSGAHRHPSMTARNDIDLSRSQVPPTLRPPQQPRRQILEEDECWVCHTELPSRLLPDFETLRSQHVEACIASVMHGSPPPPPAQSDPNRSSSSVNTISSSPEPRSAAQSRRTGVFPYLGTEKDCVDDAECTICLEEFEVGVEMGRLECFCRFHLKCIREWFVSHPGECPVHQHGGGY